MMYYGTRDFLWQQASFWETCLYASGTTRYSGNRRSRVEWWHGTRIILIGRVPNQLLISHAGVHWMIRLKKMVAFNTFPGVIVGVYCPNLLSPVTCRE